ncbi:MAG TPA: sulfatase-like hydrolase/transferase [Gemmataceae bacterium]|nr:sulfatase-like hydrolase/transferase [Gemmataceae bacterium]
MRLRDCLQLPTPLLVLLCMAAASSCPAHARAAELPSRPNILILFSDDQRADTIHALGNTHIQTPNLDRLVQEGTTFTHAYCMGALQGAVCVPSRAMLLTGRTLFRVKTNLQGQPTWPETFGRAGYSTFITGKWHNEAPGLLRSFVEGRAVFLGGMGDPYKLPVEDISENHQLVNRRLSGTHSVQLFADNVIDFLKRQKPDKPFLAYVAFNCPHDPRLAPPAYHAKYNSNKPPLPANYLPQHPFNNGALVLRDEKLAPWPRTPEIVRQHLADYYSAITFLDDQVGRILQALHASGQYDNTLIVFSSDHGLAIGSHGLFGKQNLYDHSMHAPLILAGPGVPKNERRNALCYLLDIFPTLGERAHVAGPPGSEGKSLVPILTGKLDSVRQSLFTAYTNVQRAVRDDRWKLIVYPQINKIQLFDLQNDPAEIHDLAAEPAHKGEGTRLTALLTDWQEQLGDRQPLHTDKPQPVEFDFAKVKPGTGE